VTREQSERNFRRSVERDVEALLNTRRAMIPAPDWCPELRRSVYDYGLVDTTGMPVGTKAGRDRLLATLQDAIERFEPRLGQPRIRLIDAQQVRAPQIRFVLEAVLVMDPGREDVVFDTVLQVASGEYDVHDADTSAAG
jgi:type VI secretion system lysozyme-like protein